jgi:hypothetical protein
MVTMPYVLNLRLFYYIFKCYKGVACFVKCRTNNGKIQGSNRVTLIKFSLGITKKENNYKFIRLL